MTCLCQTPLTVRAVTAGRNVVLKGHMSLSAASAVLYRAIDKGKKAVLIPCSAQVKSASEKQASGVNVYFLLAPRRG